MASTKENGAMAAAEPFGSSFGSLSLRDSAERKKSDTEPTTKSGTNPTKKLCSACGEKSNTLKKCNGCLCVWYCDKKCQNKHRKEHKKECRLIKKVLDERGGKLDLGTELEVGPRGKLPPEEECPICMHALPIHFDLHTYYVCCGKSICSGCKYQHRKKSSEQAVASTCAFCRTAAPRSNEELLARYRKRVERKDPQALNNLAMHHGEGRFGLPVDQAKCIELLRQAAGLGFPDAQYQLGNYYRTGEMGLEQNKKTAFKYYKEAADGGNIYALHNLACVEGTSDDKVAAIRHSRLSASGGLRPSMNNLIACFEDGLLHHADLAETLQAMYRSRAEMKSEHRDQYIAHLKKTGKYNAEFEY